MFPPKKVVTPAASYILATRVVVVVLPALPVIPDIGAWQSRKKSPISLSIGTPLARAFSRSGRSLGTPGANTTRSWLSSPSRYFSPRETSTPRPLSSSKVSPRSARSFRSQAVMALTPLATRNRIAALLLIPKPTTAIRSRRNSSITGWTAFFFPVLCAMVPPPGAAFPWLD